MSAPRAVGVRAPGIWRAARGIGVADLDNMFVDMIAMRVMQMTIVEVIDMVMMAHSCVSTARTMLMSVIRMMRLVAEGHVFLAYLENLSGGPGLVAPAMQRELKTPVYPLRDIAIEQSEEGSRVFNKVRWLDYLLGLCTHHPENESGRPSGVTERKVSSGADHAFYKLYDDTNRTDDHCPTSKTQ